MKFFVCACLFTAFACLSQAQMTGSIPSNAKIYVDRSSGFDTYLDMAIRKKHVPITITTEKETADYELQALSAAEPIPGSDWLMHWIHGYGEASIRVIDIRTGEAVFFARLDHNADLHNWDTAAKACASRLKTAVSRAESRIRSAHTTLDF